MIELNIKKISADKVSLDVELNGAKKNYEIKVVDNHGLFGVEFPSELSLLLHSYPSESKRLVGELRKRLAQENHLRAA